MDNKKVARVAKKIDKNFFNYKDHEKEIWNDLFGNAKDEFDVRFDLENNEPIKQKNIKIPITNTNERGSIYDNYKFKCELWTGGGDWEYMTYYFKCQVDNKKAPSMGNLFGYGSDKLFIFIPNKEQGNSHLVKGEKGGWVSPNNHEYGEDEVEEIDEKKCWESLENYLKEIIMRCEDSLGKMARVAKRIFQASRDEGIVSGALFDLAGMLTMVDEDKMIGSHRNAAWVADIVAEFCKKRGVCTDNSDVTNWSDRINKVASMIVEYLDRGLENSWQNPFPETTECVHCGGIARVAFTSYEPGQAGEVLADFYTNEKGNMWLHDSSAFCIYLCTQCLDPTALYNQG